MLPYTSLNFTDTVTLTLSYGIAYLDVVMQILLTNTRVRRTKLLHRLSITVSIVAGPPTASESSPLTIFRPVRQPCPVPRAGLRACMRRTACAPDDLGI